MAFEETSGGGNGLYMPVAPAYGGGGFGGDGWWIILLLLACGGWGGGPASKIIQETNDGKRRNGIARNHPGPP